VSSSRSVGRTLDVFELLARSPKGLTQTEIAAALSIPKGSLHDLIQVLSARGYIVQSPEGKRYRLGVRLFEVGSAYSNQMDLVEAARAVIEAINSLTGESVDLCIRDGASMIPIYKKKATFALRYDSVLGERLPGHASAVGKAILAWLGPSELHELFPSPELPAFTEKTITSLGALEAHLRGVRESAVAFNLEEMFVGICAAASAIVDRDGSPRAGISITAPTMRFMEKQGQVGELAKAGAELVATRAGYRGPDGAIEFAALERIWNRADG